MTFDEVRPITWETIEPSIPCFACEYHQADHFCTFTHGIATITLPLCKECMKLDKATLLHITTH